jgi:hypothetical protein
MRRLPLQRAPLADRVARLAEALLVKAKTLPEGSTARRRLERRAELAKLGLTNPLDVSAAAVSEQPSTV